MIDYVNKDLFVSDGVSKQIIMDYDGGQITNSQIHFEQFELQESLCSEEQLRFGCCESSMLKFRIVNPFDSLKGKELTVSEILNGDTVNPFKYGKYKVQSDVPSADRSYRDVTAYDAMYEIINADVADWYNSLTFPMSIKTFRNAFISHFGLIEEEIDLVNDTIEISKTIEPTTLSGKDVINAICEINGCFGNISRDGKFRYIYLKKLDYGLLPSTVLYPSDTLLPKDVNAAKINSGHYKSCSYEDYMVNEITQLQIRTEENDIGVLVGEEGNKYVIQDNFLVYGMSTEGLTPIAQNILDKIYFVSYQPFSVSTIGNPTIEIGDLVRINTKSVIIDSYVLKRTIKGIQSLTDTLDASGDEYYSEDENTFSTEIRKLKGKSNVLERTIEETKSTIKNVEKGLKSEIAQTAESINSNVQNVEKGLQSQITQNSENIELKVSKGEVSTQLSVENGKITLSGNRVVIDSENFHLSEDGTITAINGSFSGYFECANDEKVSLVKIEDGIVKLKTGAESYCILSGSTIDFKSSYGSEYSLLKIMGQEGIIVNEGDVTIQGTKVKETIDSIKSSYLPLSGGTVSGTIGAINIQAGNQSTNGGLELYHDTPFIDFHFGRSIADYTHRIIAESSSALAVTSDLNVNGYCRTKQNFVCQSNGHGIYGKHTDGSSSIRIAVASTSNNGAGGNAVNCTIHGDGNYRGYLIGASLYSNKAITNYSDERLKKNFTALDDRYLVMADNISPELFNWITYSDDDRKQVGYVAQKVLQAMIDAGIKEDENTIVKRCEDVDNPEYGEILTLDYNGISAIYAYALKDARTKLKNQGEEIENLKQIIQRAGLV